MHTNRSGLRMVLKEYQEVAMKHIWTLNGEGASSRDVWMAVNKEMPEKIGGKKAISRASIINSLNWLVDNEVLDYHEITGKGGHRRIYSAKHDEAGFKAWVAKTVLDHLVDNFETETKTALGFISWS